MIGTRRFDLVRTLLFALLLVLPLVPDPGWFTDFDLPKRLVLFPVLLFVLVVVFFRAVRRKDETKVPVPVVLATLAGLAFVGLVFAKRAPDGRLAIDVLGEIGGLAAFGILAARYLSDDLSTRTAFSLVAIAGAIVALLGIVGWPFGTSSTLGNPSFAAEYAAGALPLAVALYFLGRRMLSIVATVLLATFLVMAKSRADLLGVVVAAVVVGVLLFLGRRSRRPKIDEAREEPGPAGHAVSPRPRTVGVLTAILLAGIVASPWAIDVLPVPLFGRSDTVAIRRHIREATLQMALDRPATGVGLGGFRAAFPHYRHPKEAELSLGREVTFPHNLPLLVFSETGVLGLIILLFFLGSTLFAASRSALVRPPDPLALGAAGAFTAMIVSAQFSAPLRHPASAVLFFLLAGLFAARRPRRFVTHLRNRYRRAIPVFVLIVPIGLATVLLPSRTTADVLYADVLARERATNGEMNDTIRDLLESSIAARPTPNALRQLATYLNLEGHPEQAEACLDRLFRIAPFDYPGHIERARAYLVAGHPGKAENLLGKLEKERPEDKTVRFLRGIAEIRLGNRPQAWRFLLTALREMPRDAARWNARQVAQELPGASSDVFLDQVAAWRDTKQALAVLASFHTGWSDFIRAVLNAREGRLDTAMEALKRAVRSGAVTTTRLRYDPRLAPLRDRADFRALLPH